MPVPRLHRLHIEKFRRIQEPLELDLTTPRGEPLPTIVLAGPNGAGKTSILEAVLLGLGAEHLIVRDLERARRDQHWRGTVPAGASIELDVSLDGGPVSTWIRTADKHVRRSADGTEAPLALEPRQTLAIEYFSSWRAPELVGPIKPLVGRGGRPTDNENNRLWRLKQRIIDERARGGYSPAAPGTSKADLWLERINAAWRRFHGDDGTRIDAQIVEAEEEEGLLADLFVMRGEERVCSVDLVSSGEIELLSFAGWIIVNDFDGDLLVTDEPELHLHQQWQVAILPALRELAPGAQFLVASHSDAVRDQVHSFERFLLVPETDPRSEAWRRGSGGPLSQPLHGTTAGAHRTLNQELS